MDRRHSLKSSAGTIGLALMAQTSRGQDGKQTQSTMRIKLSSVYVDDQDKALKFYTVSDT